MKKGIIIVLQKIPVFANKSITGVKFMLVFAVLLSGCAARQNAALKEMPKPECASLYVLLPGNYIIDLAAGAEVFLNPHRQEFKVFCKIADARKALAQMQKTMNFAKDWKIYILEESGANNAGACYKDELCLKTETRVTGWL